MLNRELKCSLGSWIDKFRNENKIHSDTSRGDFNFTSYTAVYSNPVLGLSVTLGRCHATTGGGYPMMLRYDNRIPANSDFKCIP